MHFLFKFIDLFTGQSEPSLPMLEINDGSIKILFGKIWP